MVKKSHLFGFLVAILSFFVLNSCNDSVTNSTEKLGDIKFQINSGGTALLKTESDTVAKQIFITLQDQSGKEVVTARKIELVSFGTGLISLPVSLPEGNYTLTDFFVTNSLNQTIYAAPKTGSEKAYLVSHPLPLQATISANQTTTLSVEVVAVNTVDTPSLFGYISFPINISETLNVFVAIMALNQASGTLELVPSTVTITVNNNSYLSKSLDAKTNLIVLNKFNDDDVISFNVTSNDYGSKKFSYTYASLAEQKGSPVIFILPGKTDPAELKALAWYPLDGSPSDISGNQLDGVNFGAVETTDRSGNAAGALYFNGNSSINLGDILNSNGFPFSVTAWIRTESNQMIGRIFHSDFNVSQDAYYGFGVFSRQGKFDISTGDGFGLGWSNRYGIQTNSTYPLQSWYHLAVVFTSSYTYSIYVNGVLVQSSGDGGSGQIAHNNDPAVIGAKFIGSIDDVRLFGSALTDNDISAIYNTK
ncbi:MAG: LamG domain-containing protein [Bacteroidetes bacterium]|nr:LamG domain-containing protein [Bacteroidota bacterium]